MVVWILFISFLSFIFIYLVHQIFLFFKSTLTTPKIKDFIYSPSKKYDEIYQTINSKNNTVSSNDTTMINNLHNRASTPSDMKNDLKTFLKSQLQSIA